MIYPSVNALMEKVDSRYTLCTLAGKRARQLADGANRLSNVDSTKEVTIAVNEIYEDKVVYTKIKTRIK